MFFNTSIYFWIRQNIGEIIKYNGIRINSDKRFMTSYTWLASVDEILEILETFWFFERTIMDQVDYETMWIGLHISLVTEWKTVWHHQWGYLDLLWQFRVDVELWTRIWPEPLFFYSISCSCKESGCGLIVWGGNRTQYVKYRELYQEITSQPH